MRTVSNRWLNAALFCVLLGALYLHFTYRDTDLEDYYKTQAKYPPADFKGSISAR